MNNECRTISAMRIHGETRSTRRKLSPNPLRPPQIPHHLTLALTWQAVMVTIYDSNINTIFSLTILTLTDYKMAEPYILPAELRLKEEY
jgi:hypothetical protein